MAWSGVQWMRMLSCRDRRFTNLNFASPTPVEMSLFLHSSDLQSLDMLWDVLELRLSKAYIAAETQDGNALDRSRGSAGLHSRQRQHQSTCTVGCNLALLPRCCSNSTTTFSTSKLFAMPPHEADLGSDGSGFRARRLGRQRCPRRHPQGLS